MVIRVGRREEDERRASVLAALHQVSGVPPWLCEWAWTESLENRKGALELLKQLKSIPSTIEATREALEAMETPLRRARLRGRDSARADLDAKRFYRLCAGLVREPPSYCPRCRIRIPFVSRPPNACETCGTALFHVRSTGCAIGPDTRPFIDGYRAEVDGYLRERFPLFSWDNVSST